MKQRTMLLALATLTITATLVAADAPLPLVNPSFETGAIEGWTTWGDPAYCSWSTATEWASEGSYAFAWTDTSSSSSCGLYQTIAVNPGERYAAAVVVVVEQGTPQLYLRWVDANGADVGPFPVATASGTGLQVLEVEGDAPAGATHARVWLYSTTADVSSGWADVWSILPCGYGGTCILNNNDCGVGDAPNAHTSARGLWLPFDCSGSVSGNDNDWFRFNAERFRDHKFILEGNVRACIETTKRPGEYGYSSDCYVGAFGIEQAWESTWTDSYYLHVTNVAGIDANYRISLKRA